MIRIPQSSYQRQVWKNGGGLTDEIMRFPTEHDFVWRLSRARVDSSGPFSIFAGYQRWLTIIDGAGVRLNAESLSVGEVRHFSGCAVTDCQLISGAVVDLGLIYDPRVCTAKMEWVGVGRNEAKFLYAVEDLILAGEKIVRGDTVELQGPVMIDSGRAILIDIRSK